MSLRRKVLHARKETWQYFKHLHTKWNTEATCTCSTCGPAKIEYELLHPAVKGATLATLCENCAKDNPQNWWAVWGVEVKPPGTNKFNVLSMNYYSTLVPGYLSLCSNYSSLNHMVPNLNKVLRNPVGNEKYALYLEFERKGTYAEFWYWCRIWLL
jgi:hypothetical protein